MALKLLKYGGATCDDEEKKALFASIEKSIESGNWQAGEEARLMEKEAAEQLKVKYGILTASGSCAGLLALCALELPKGSEVIISACTFPTIFNIILQCGLVPVVVDAKVGTYNFDVDEVENAISPKTKAIIAIHILGNPCDMPRLMEIANKNNLYVIEDNCDGWGSSIAGRPVGSFGHVSITSFHAAHIVSMGVGGGVFTDDEEIARKVRMYRDWGRQSDATEANKYPSLPLDYNSRFIYEKIGYNFQVLELQAAMGRVQLRKAEMIKAKRKANFEYLKEHLAKYKFTMPKSIEGADVCWFAFPITHDGDRGKLTGYLESKGIETRSLMAGNIIKHPAYKDSIYRVAANSYTGELWGASTILNKSFWITCHPSLTEEDRERIVQTFDDYFSFKD